ncbi:hypothetical protein C1701_11450 [Actinoalloteichus sp. AHMU CJ021]|uniref:Uncharacterized protein n=1 Tax=Actinoalloteichus caeruleus DSM 43889 TaxID=1120930 RepID=A0ABT1JKN4_ACTCY|nr:hypothetical protein [Actinoalloteichus caeruleus]AUS78870.1 hypothetical protein C1701_11450 [Actinoalloteichus sp. AHMU CJ021]MCP2333069.1 hypothetical protein [Actinoalloteichus caeruleus DSM 43889]
MLTMAFTWTAVLLALGVLLLMALSPVLPDVAERQALRAEEKEERAARRATAERARRASRRPEALVLNGSLSTR